MDKYTTTLGEFVATEEWQARWQLPEVKDIEIQRNELLREIELLDRLARIEVSSPKLIKLRGQQQILRKQARVLFSKMHAIVDA